MENLVRLNSVVTQQPRARKSEWNIVVGYFHIRRRGLAWGLSSRRLAWGLSSRGGAGSSGNRVVASAAANELHVGGMNLERVALFAIAVRPLFHAHSAFDIYGPAFGEVLRRSLGLPTPKRNPKPRGDVLRFTGFIFALFVGRQRETADGSALRGITQLRVAAQIAYQYYFVE